MNKHLLLGTALLAAISAFPQAAKQVKPSGIINGQSIMPFISEKEGQNTTVTTNNNPVKHVVKNNNVTAKITALSVTRFTGSMNAFGVLVSEARNLQYNPGANIVSFVHRKSATYVATANSNSGTQVVMTSNNSGSNWDSTCIWANGTDLGRYPTGGVYNPLGNATYTNAYVCGSGPITDGTNWKGSWMSSKKITSPGNATAGANQQSMLNASLPAGMKVSHFARYAFESVDGGLTRTMAQILNDPAGTTNLTYGPRGAMMVKGLFSAGAFTWSTDSFAPSCTLRGDGSRQMNNNTPLQAWNNTGTIGYVIILGSRNGAPIPQKGYQPLIYKTTNSGASWSLLPGNDFTTASFRGLTDRLYPIVTNSNVIIPSFNAGEGMDATVDINNNLHIVTTVIGTYSSHNDSVGYNYSFGTEQYSWDYSGAFGYPTIYDFYTTTAGGWNYHIVDSMGTEGPSGTSGYPGYSSNPWSDGSTSKVGLDARIQISRTADGKRIFYSWTESDSTVTGLKWNIYPDLKYRGYDVTTDKVTPRMNVTSGSGIATVEQLAYFHYMSNRAISTTTVCFDIPYTITNNPTNNGGIAVDHYYVKGVQVCTSAFTITPLRPTGVTSLANNTPSYEVNLYPNPAGQAVTVSVSLKAATDVEISVYNSIGQHIQTMNFNGAIGSNDVFMDLTKLNAGVYFYKVKADGSVVTKKLIIE